MAEYRKKQRTNQPQIKEGAHILRKEEYSADDSNLDNQVVYISNSSNVAEMNKAINLKELKSDSKAAAEKKTTQNKHQVGLPQKMNFRQAQEYQLNEDDGLDTDEAIIYESRNRVSRNESGRSQAKTIPTTKTKTKKEKQEDEIVMSLSQNDYQAKADKNSKNPQISKYKKFRHKSLQRKDNEIIKGKGQADDKRHTIDQEVLSTYQKYITKTNAQQRGKSEPKNTSHKRISKSRDVDKSKPYGFRTLKVDNLTESAHDENSPVRSTPFTAKLIKEYYCGKGCIPKSKIYDALFSPVGPSRFMDKKAQEELTERLMKHKDKVREKNKLNQLQQEFILSKEVQNKETFKKPVPVNLSEDYKMYNQQLKCEIKRKAKMYDKALEEMRKEKEIMAQAKPCPGSERLANQMQRKGSIHYKLYCKGTQKLHKRRGVKVEVEAPEERPVQNSSCTFQPQINKKSKKVNAVGKVEDRLIQDAKKRITAKAVREEAKIKDIKSISNPKHGAKTQSYAYKRFLKEYDDTLIAIGKEKGDSFTYKDLCEVLSKLGFIIDQSVIDTPDSIISDVWIILGGESQEFVNESSIFNILCIILNFNYPFLYCEEFMTPEGKNVKGVTENEIDKNTVGLIGKDGVFYLRSENEIQRLHSYFYDLTFNRINFINNQAQIKKNRRENFKENNLDQKPDSFKPKIDIISNSIETNKMKVLGKEPRHKMLLNKGKEYKANISERIMKSKEKELEGCSFVPKTNNSLTKRPKMNDSSQGDANFSIEGTKSKLKKSLEASNSMHQQSHSGSVCK